MNGEMEATTQDKGGILTSMETIYWSSLTPSQ